jgi:hypothetical protein
MRTAYRRLALAILTICAFGIQESRAAEPCTPPQRIATIPFDPNESSTPHVPVSLEGRQTQLLLSTSAYWSGLRRDLVREFGIRTVSDYNAARVSDFKLGSVPYAGSVDFVVDKRVSDKPIERYGGVLGLNLLTRYDLEIDNAGKKISLFSEDHCSGAGVYWTDEALTLLIDKRRPVKYLGTEVKAKDYENQIVLPIAQVIVGGKEASAIFDTASEGTIVDTFFAKDHLGVTPVAPYTHTFKSFTVSGMEFANMPARFVRLRGVDVVLGMNELKKLRLYFAFKDGMIHITAADAGQPLK